MLLGSSQYSGSYMNSCFVRVLLTATVAAMAAATICPFAYAQSNLGSVQAQYSSGNPQHVGQSGSDSSLSPLYGSPPGYELDYLSGDDVSSSIRSQASARGGATRSTRSSQGTRFRSLYGAPTDYEDSYSVHLGNRPRTMNRARQLTSYGIAAVEGLASPGVGSGERTSSAKATSRWNTGRVRTGQQGDGSMPGSSTVAPESPFVTRLDSAAGGDAAVTLYRSPW
ncbi:hypothetical protein DR64_8727 [Paraburkholderia xenovorans LB400]|uniref:Uncharacterized protein n=1 Tax=Paraburkholderia xenovorans (strain LB400) TaxID=266265 RepID=Q13G49_PARXL|nr:hypothetical protein Bxe_C1073 [Paraburkholderia xenovorans LB400]AIP34923.1 hypothetical protein DR64_8727 [Paraburkholderia xenovorans LB400]